MNDVDLAILLLVLQKGEMAIEANFETLRPGIVLNLDFRHDCHCVIMTACFAAWPEPLSCWPPV
jgi:hypothetical protein